MGKRELTWTEKQMLWQRRVSRALFILAGAVLLWSGVTLARCLLLDCGGDQWLNLGINSLVGIIGLGATFAVRSSNREALLRFQRRIWRARSERFAAKRRAKKGG